MLIEFQGRPLEIRFGEEFWGSNSLVGYESTDCSGAPYVQAIDSAPNEDGSTFAVSTGGRVYRTTGGTAVSIDWNSLLQYDLNGGDDACLARSGRLPLSPAEFVGKLPFVFPFHLRIAAGSDSSAEIEALSADIDALAEMIGALEDSDQLPAGEIQGFQQELERLRSRVSAIEAIPNVANRLRTRK